MSKHFKNTQHYRVNICPHGHVHLRIGNVTLHLSTEDLSSLTQLSIQALEEHRQNFSEGFYLSQNSVTH